MIHTRNLSFLEQKSEFYNLIIEQNPIREVIYLQLCFGIELRTLSHSSGDNHLRLL